MEPSESPLDALAERVRAALGLRTLAATPAARAPAPTHPAELGPFLDHTLLRPDATVEDVRRFAEEAASLGCAGACVHPRHVKTVARALEGSTTVPIAVVGFPLGATLTRVKVFEAKAAREEGAAEVDVVIDLGAVRERELLRARDELAEVVRAVPRCAVKVILETSVLSDEEKVCAALAAESAGAAFVKTSTGFQGGGATEADVTLLRRVLLPHVRIKASGGVRTAAAALALIRAGADRIGTSSAAALVSGGAGASAY